MNSVWERMLAEGVKCLYCGNKMERTTRQEFESASGLHEYVSCIVIRKTYQNENGSGRKLRQERERDIKIETTEK